MQVGLKVNPPGIRAKKLAGAYNKHEIGNKPPTNKLSSPPRRIRKGHIPLVLNTNINPQSPSL
jgi:hypothetical protein